MILGVAVIVGIGRTVTVEVAEVEAQPPTLTETEYWVVEAGLTTIACVVAPVLHE